MEAVFMDNRSRQMQQRLDNGFAESARLDQLREQVHNALIFALQVLRDETLEYLATRVDLVHLSQIREACQDIPIVEQGHIDADRMLREVSDSTRRYRSILLGERERCKGFLGDGSRCAVQNRSDRFYCSMHSDQQAKCNYLAIVGLPMDSELAIVCGKPMSFDFETKETIRILCSHHNDLIETKFGLIDTALHRSRSFWLIIEEAVRETVLPRFYDIINCEQVKYDDCSICLEKLSDVQEDMADHGKQLKALTQPVCRLKCSHQFHEVCLLGYLLKSETDGRFWNASCPHCRFQIFGLPTDDTESEGGSDNETQIAVEPDSANESDNRDHQDTRFDRRSTSVHEHYSPIFRQQSPILRQQSPILRQQSPTLSQSSPIPVGRGTDIETLISNEPHSAQEVLDTDHQGICFERQSSPPLGQSSPLLGQLSPVLGHGDSDVDTNISSEPRSVDESENSGLQGARVQPQMTPILVEETSNDDQEMSEWEADWDSI